MRTLRPARALLGATLIAMSLSAACTGDSDAKGDGGAAAAAGDGGVADAPGAGNGGPPSGVGGGGGAAGQCQQFVKTLCGRLVECSPPVDAGAGVAGQCERYYATAFGCERAAKPFDTCQSELKVLSCTSLRRSLPGACDEALEDIPASEAQLKCGEVASAVCIRTFQCLGGRPSQQALLECQAEYVERLGCEIAIGVGPTHAKCLDEIKGLACPSNSDGGAPDAGAGAMPGMMSGAPSCIGAVKTLEP